MIERQLTKDGTYTLYSDAYNQTYHSMHGSKAEAEHVFLKGTGVLERLRRQDTINLLEIGFGAGLNFFLTGDHALQHEAPLSYYSFEQNLLPAEVFASLHYDKLIAQPQLVKQFLTWRKQLDEKTGLQSCKINDHVQLHLILGDATTTPIPDVPIDAVYLDAFSPDQNPELWTVPFLRRLYTSLNQGGTLATYSAKSMVRKNLIAAGFDTHKRPGPPGKREMLVGIKPA